VCLACFRNADFVPTHFPEIRFCAKYGLRSAHNGPAEYCLLTVVVQFCFGSLTVCLAIFRNADFVPSHFPESRCCAERRSRSAQNGPAEYCQLLNHGCPVQFRIFDFVPCQFPENGFCAEPLSGKPILCRVTVALSTNCPRGILSINHGCPIRSRMFGRHVFLQAGRAEAQTKATAYNCAHYN
jgi:hypothetical protein